MEQLKEMIEQLSEPKFYSIKDVAKIINWSEKTVQELFNREDFPSCDFGKEKKVEKYAFTKYFETKRKRGE